ncbi:MAG: NERD domain-containing protein [Candidatus Altimarinota bacterium]
MKDIEFLEKIEREIVNDIKKIIYNFDKNQILRFIFLTVEDIFNPNFDYYKNDTRREVLASEFSFVLYLLSLNGKKYNAIKIMNFDYNKFAINHAKKIENLIELLYKRHYINEYKLYVKNQDYVLNIEDDTIKLNHPIENFHYYYSLGYVRNTLEDIAVSMLSIHNPKGFNVDDIVKLMTEEKFNVFNKIVKFEIRDQGLKGESIVFAFAPSGLGTLTKFGTKEFNNRIFSLQQKYLDSSNINITDTLYENTKLTWWDIIKMSMAFYYISLYMSYIIDKYATSERMKENSKLLIMKKEELVYFMEELLVFINNEISLSDVRSFISRFTTNLVQNYGVNNDIQFRPLVKFDSERYAILFNVLGQVNIGRAFLDNKFKDKDEYDKNIVLDDQGKKFEKEIIDLLKQKFNESNIVTSIKYKRNLEIDICLIGNKNIYFFECKNPSHPYSSISSKSIYDYFKKGIKQLNDGVVYFENNKKNFIKNHFPNLNIEDINEYKIVKVLMMSTRNLSGLHYGDIVVRDFYSLRQTIEEGKIPINTIGSNNDIEKTYRSLWKKTIFSEEDFLNYLSEKSIFFDELQYIIEKVTHTLEYKNYRLEVVEFGVDISK